MNELETTHNPPSQFREGTGKYRAYVVDEDGELKCVVLYGVSDVCNMLCHLTFTNFDTFVRLLPETVKTELRNRL